MATPASRQELIEQSLDNKYRRWYFSIIDSALFRNWTKKTAPCYVEYHHIIPCSISGLPRRIGDVVALTAREHFICHCLLPKFLTGSDKLKMQLALHRLMTGINSNYCKTSIMYERIKRDFVVAASTRSKNYWSKLDNEARSAMRAKEKNSRWGAVLSDLTREKISIANKGKLAGSKHPQWGKCRSEKTKIKISMANKGKFKGSKNPNYGKVGAARGKKWYSNLELQQEKYFIPGTEPVGFILGRS